MPCLAEGLEPPTFAFEGGTSVLVKALLVTNRVNLSTSQYLGVPVRCYAGVMPRGGLSRRGAAKRPRSLGGH